MSFENPFQNINSNPEAEEKPIEYESNKEIFEQEIIESKYIERSIDTDHHIITGFSKKRNLFEVKKVDVGDLVDIYDKKYLVLGFTHSTKKEKEIYVIKNLAHLKEISEEETEDINKRKKQYNDLIEIGNNMNNFRKLRDEHYQASPNKKKEIENSINEIKYKIDTEFLTKLEVAKDLTLDVDEKRSLVSLFNKYGRYLYEQDHYNFKKSKEYAKAVELTSSSITDGADSFNIEENERFNLLNEKVNIEKNLLADEVKELDYLKQKKERIEQLLTESQWRQLNYEPFDPKLEIKKIRYFSEDERKDRPFKKRIEIQKERLSDYKKKLLKQKENIAEIQISIEKSVRDNPDLNIEELMDIVYLKSPKAELTNYQIDAFRKGIGEYVKKHQAVENYRTKYPNDKALYSACFGHSPKGNIEIIKGPMTLYFRCHDIEDYARIYSQKTGQEDSIDIHNLTKANLSGGVAISSGGNEGSLRGCIIAENSRNRLLNKETLIHEEQHAIQRLFENEITKKELIQVFKKLPIEEQEKALLSYLRLERENFEDRAKDEILAYFKDGTELGEIKKIILNSKEQGELYDYYREWYEKEGRNEREDYIKAGASEYFINNCFSKVFRSEYRFEIVNPAIESLWNLKNNGLSKEKIINLLINEPLSGWPKFRERLEDTEKNYL